MVCHEEIINYMHDYLDEEITDEHKEALKAHLTECRECRVYFHDMKKAVALVQSTALIKAPSDFTDKVMASLPKEKKKAGFQRWFRSHPFMTAAAMFLILMGGTLFSNWSEDQDFSVSRQPNLVVENKTVIVPAGEVVEGDVLVRNGDIRIEGEVRGDVTVINGEQYMASAGNVTGQIEEIDEMFEWLWFKMKDTAKGLF